MELAGTAGHNVVLELYYGPRAPKAEVRQQRSGRRRHAFGQKDQRIIKNGYSIFENRLPSQLSMIRVKLPRLPFACSRYLFRVPRNMYLLLVVSSKHQILELLEALL